MRRPSLSNVCAHVLSSSDVLQFGYLASSTATVRYCLMCRRLTVVAALRTECPLLLRRVPGKLELWCGLGQAGFHAALGFPRVRIQDLAFFFLTVVL